MKIKDIWEAIENEVEVCWENDLYYIHKIEVKEENEFNRDTYKNGFALRCTCKSNYFGSLLEKSEFKKCYIKEN